MIPSIVFAYYHYRQRINGVNFAQPVAVVEGSNRQLIQHAVGVNGSD